MEYSKLEIMVLHKAAFLAGQFASISGRPANWLDGKNEARAFLARRAELVEMVIASRGDSRRISAPPVDSDLGQSILNEARLGHRYPAAIWDKREWKKRNEVTE